MRFSLLGPPPCTLAATATCPRNTTLSSALRCLRSLPAFQPGKAVRPSSAPLGVALRRDVQYSPSSPGPRTLLDVYCPVDSESGTEGSDAGHPVIVFLHGGVWASGEKWWVRSEGCALLRSGGV